MRQRQHRQRHQPQRELRTPHLVGQQEPRHHQERQLRHPRAARRGQRDVADHYAAGREQRRADRVQHGGGLPEAEVRIETGPAGERLHHVVQRVHVITATGVEPEELRPAPREQHHDRQVDQQPGAHCCRRGLADLPQTPGPDRQQRQRDQQQQRIQLGRHPQTDQHAGEHRSSAGPGEQGTRRESRCQRIEVGEDLEDDDRRGGHQRGVPDASRPGQHRRGPQCGQPCQRQPERGDVEEHHHLGHDRHRRQPGQRRVGLGDRHRQVLVDAGQHRILHVAHGGFAVVGDLRRPVVVGLHPAGLVRELAQVQQLRGVERHGVRIAELVVGAVVLPVGDPLLGGAGAGGLQARRFRRIAQRQEHQRDQHHHPQRSQEAGATDQRVPADRPADRARQRGADRVGAAGQVAIVETPPVARRPSRRIKLCRPSRRLELCRPSRRIEPCRPSRRIELCRPSRSIEPGFGLVATVRHGGGGGAPGATGTPGSFTGAG